MSQIIKSNDENQLKAKLLLETIKTLSYGTILTHDQISELIKEPYPSNGYKRTIAKVRKMLIKNRIGICLENIPGDGYKITEPDSFVDVGLNHYKRGFKQIQTGFKILESAPVKKMTPEGREIFQKVYDRSIVLNASIAGTRIELKTLARKRHPLDVEN